MDFRFLCPDKWDMSRGVTFSCLSVVIIVRRSKWLVHFPSSFAAATTVYPVNVFQEAVSWTKLQFGGFSSLPGIKDCMAFSCQLAAWLGSSWRTSQDICLCRWYKYVFWSLSQYAKWRTAFCRLLLSFEPQGLPTGLSGVRPLPSNQSALCCWASLYGLGLLDSGRQVVLLTKAFPCRLRLAQAFCSDGVLFLVGEAVYVWIQE